MTNNISLIHTQKIVIFAPHPDDAELGCGGMIRKRLTIQRETHIVHLTDGRNSHLLVFGIKERPRPSELKELRKREVIEAQQILGNRPESLHFFDYQDGILFFSRKAAIKKTIEFLHTLKPALILVPYRNDRHPDHIATYNIVTAAIQIVKLHIPIYQYFVHSLRHILLSSNPNVLHIDIRDELETKKAAILRFKTQTTCFSEQQPRAVLTSDFLESFYSDEELFLSSSNVHELLFSPMISTARSWLMSYKNRYYLRRKLLEGKQWNRADVGQ